MGLFNWIKNQFIEIIEWTDATRGTIVWRFPHHDNQIKNGAKLIVREGQVAIFVSEGQMADVFKPGLYELTTQNLPVLADLRGWKYGFNSPFRSEIYFITTTQYLDMKWGTMSPITLRDADLGIVRLRAHGIYAVRVDAEGAQTFFKEIVGTDGHVTTSEIEGHLRSILLSNFTTAMGNLKVPFLDLAAEYQKIGELCQNEIAEAFAAYGIKLTKLVVQNISVPAEVQKAMDQRASVSAVGNLQAYTQYQAAQAMREGAASGTSTSAAMMDMAVGVSMGQAMASTMSQSMGQLAQPPAAADTVSERLRKLKALKEEGLINDEIFAQKRDAILAEI
jgi:membrane protease subunit (stomatin/prohibitin family)